MDRQPCDYIMASRPNGTLYIGVTSNLPQRVAQHKAGMVAGFTKKYRVNQLVWYEPHETMENAIAREKQMKKWKRAWKAREIARRNPHWEDLAEEITS